MIVENWKSELEKNLPDVEKFLTSVLQEDSKITVTSAESADKNDVEKNLNKDDIIVIATDEVHLNSIILVLDNEWFGLLSSIMMGVEEKTNNEITRDLLKKFTTELSVTVKKQIRKDAGFQLSPGEIEVLTTKQMQKRFKHGEYFHAKLMVSGLADDDVRAELLIGNPEVLLSGVDSDAKKSDEKEQKDSKSKKKDEKPDPVSDKEAIEKTEDKEKPVKAEAGNPPVDESESVPEAETTASEKLFSQLDAEDLKDDSGGVHVDESQVVSGRKVEFEGFDGSGQTGNGNSRSMALLKDVEMEVSVQLGQIEMPLGKVLQLAKGSIIELDKLAGEPVDILVNGSKIAHGEVVVIDEHFGVRITNLITTRDRIAQIR